MFLFLIEWHYIMLKPCKLVIKFMIPCQGDWKHRIFLAEYKIIEPSECGRTQVWGLRINIRQTRKNWTPSLQVTLAKKKKKSWLGALIIIIILHTVLLAVKVQKFSIPGDTVADDLIKCPRS